METLGWKGVEVEMILWFVTGSCECVREGGGGFVYENNDYKFLKRMHSIEVIHTQEGRRVHT
jgi:hypothetical protein